MLTILNALWNHLQKAYPFSWSLLERSWWPTQSIMGSYLSGKKHSHNAGF